MYRHFTALINYKMNLMGLNNSQGAQLCGMCQKTFEKKKTSPERFRLDEVMTVFEKLNFSDDEKREALYGG